jgi:hypothetical protein
MFSLTANIITTVLSFLKYSFITSVTATWFLWTGRRQLSLIKNNYVPKNPLCKLVTPRYFYVPIHLFWKCLESGLTVQLARHSSISGDCYIMFIWWWRWHTGIQVNPSGKNHGVPWGKHYLTAYQFFLLGPWYEDNLMNTSTVIIWTQ